MAKILGVHVPDGIKNYIINGDMNIAQRGTSFTSIASLAYSMDRWKYVKNGAVVHNITQDSDVPSFSQSGYNFKNSLRLTLTTPDTSIAATDFAIISQVIEGNNWANLHQKGFTISFWVKATLPGVYTIGLQNSGIDRAYVAEYTINSVSTWEYKTVYVPASPSAGTWNLTNGAGLYVQWVLAAGSNFNTTAGAWQTGNFFSTANQINGTNTGATDFRLTGVQITEGQLVMPFRNFAEGIDGELLACKRYYEIVFQSANQSFGWITATAGGATAAEGGVPWFVEKRANPSVTTNIDLIRVGGGGNAISAFTMSVPDTKGLRFNLTTTGLTTGQVYTIYNSGSPAGTGVIRADSEL